MSQLQQTGRICHIGQTVNFQSQNGNTYYRRTLVLDITRCDMYTGERSPYENYTSFDFDGENCRMLDGFTEGQVVTVDFALSGRKYNDKQTGEVKYFNSIRGFKVTPREQAAPVASAQPPVQPAPEPAYQTGYAPVPPQPQQDNLPF